MQIYLNELLIFQETLDPVYLIFQQVFMSQKLGISSQENSLLSLCLTNEIPAIHELHNIWLHMNMDKEKGIYGRSD